MEQRWQGAAEVTYTLFLFTYKSLAFMFYLVYVKANKITMKLLKITGESFRKKQVTVKPRHFALPCNINNFDGIENSRG